MEYVICELKLEKRLMALRVLHSFYLLIKLNLFTYFCITLVLSKFGIPRKDILSQGIFNFKNFEICHILLA